jgi:hypothetical protein
MRTTTRLLLASTCAAVMAAAACSKGAVESPAAPSDSNGATIAGTVNSGVSVPLTPAGATAAAPPAGMTVAVVGTNLSATVDDNGKFQIAGVPPGNVQLAFRDNAANATVQIANVGAQELIQIDVTVDGSTATVVNEVRSSGKISICHRTDAGFYNLIEISVSAEPAHRAHGDAKVGEPVPADPTKVFDSSCKPTAATGPSVDIQKFTNGQDADEAPGPSITIGTPVTWTYVVTNTGGVDLTAVVVTDNRGVAVSCGGNTTLAVGQSMTCTGSGVAVAGQYTNIGTVTASSMAGPVSDSDPSNYFGDLPDDGTEGPKIDICHRTGSGRYNLINISVNAEPAHRAHGDAKIGEAVPGSPGKVFGPGCVVQ